MYRWLAGLARVLEATTHWVLANVGPDADAPAAIDELRGGLSRLRGDFAGMVTGEDRKVFLERLGELQDLGVDRVLGERLITLRFLPQLLDVLRIARDGGTDALETAQAYYRVADRFATAQLRLALREVAGDAPWDRRFAQTLAEDVTRAQRAIVQATLHAGAADGVDGALEEFTRTRARETQAYRDTLDEVRSDEGATLAGWALAVRALRGVAGG